MHDGEEVAIVTPEKLPTFLEALGNDIRHESAMEDAETVMNEAGRRNLHASDRSIFSVPEHSLLMGYYLVRGVRPRACLEYIRTQGFAEYVRKVEGQAEEPRTIACHFFAHGIAFGIKLKRGLEDRDT